MKKKNMLILLVGSFTSSIANAEVYRWVDEQGSVHFGDKAHSNNKAKDISHDVQLKNLDHSAKRTQQTLQQMDLRQQARATEAQQKQPQTSSEQSKRQCVEAENRLRILQGRVAFYDENNQEIKVTEIERQQRADTLKTWFNKYCS